jgi:16S rRNA (cytosine1402-N4)-methyltransferase
MTGRHIPVMVDEVLEALALEGSEMVVDATFGGGGHTRRILDELGPEGRVIGIDRDPEARDRALALADEDERFEFRFGSYDEVLTNMADAGEVAEAIFFDLGLSSFQIDDPARGFSYVHSGALDMRMNPEEGISAAEFLNTADEQEIRDVLREYGDVKRAGAVAREIVRRRPLESTADLVAAIRVAVGWVERGGNPAKRVFQAVRIYVNDELSGLRRALPAAERILVPGGRLVALTFHSGEDRLVKRFIVDRSRGCVCPPDLPICVCGAEPAFRRGPVRKPSEAEAIENPRSASARLRVAIKAGPESG